MRNYRFTGCWQGDGADAEDNEFTFTAEVSHLGDNKYRILILDMSKKPIHIMDGVLENNRFSYTSDEDLYKGGGILSKDLFEGYYKGPIEGTFKMWRIK